MCLCVWKEGVLEKLNSLLIKGVLQEIHRYSHSVWEPQAVVEWLYKHSRNSSPSSPEIVKESQVTWAWYETPSFLSVSFSNTKTLIPQWVHGWFSNCRSNEIVNFVDILNYSIYCAYSFVVSHTHHISCKQRKNWPFAIFRGNSFFLTSLQLKWRSTVRAHLWDATRQCLRLHFSLRPRNTISTWPPNWSVFFSLSLLPTP